MLYAFATLNNDESVFEFEGVTSLTLDKLFDELGSDKYLRKVIPFKDYPG